MKHSTEKKEMYKSYENRGERGRESVGGRMCILLYNCFHYSIIT